MNDPRTMSNRDLQARAKAATDAELVQMTSEPLESFAVSRAAKDEMNLRAYAAEMAAVKVGDGMTDNIGSDRYAVTVIARTPATITVQRDETCNVAVWPAQEWISLPNPQGGTEKFTRRKDGRFRPQGCSHGLLTVGRNHYSDPSF